MPFPQHVKVVEVGPRDGLQNESQHVPTEIKVELIERLIDAGVKFIEAAAFVSPKWVPQMSDGAEVMRRVARRPGVIYSALVPNMKGFEAAIEAGCDEVAVFAAASETFSLKNINCGVRESIERFHPVAEAAKNHGVRVRGYVSCAVGCPYEGEVAPGKVADIVTMLEDLGCHEISLGDTIGVGTPGKTKAMIEACGKRIPVERLAGHYHDTYGMAIANIYASLELGVGVFDSSVAGLGGCPYAPGAAGNVATEDVVYLLDGLNIETGIDLGKLAEAGEYICSRIGRAPASRVARALAAKRRVK
ncbi:MAG: hydroxymethylglutaryl-CoA lyase [Burkholderiales bacterium]